jgi:hypothetical protein
MRLLGKILSLLSVIGATEIGLFTITAHANTSSDDLYSESIYIQKSSAEVPTSLDSNARSNANSEAQAAAPSRAIESVAELDSAPAAKKTSQ